MGSGIAHGVGKALGAGGVVANVQKRATMCTDGASDPDQTAGQPSQADMARAIQLAAKAALGGGEGSSGEISTDSLIDKSTPFAKIGQQAFGEPSASKPQRLISDNSLLQAHPVMKCWSDGYSAGTRQSGPVTAAAALGSLGVNTSKSSSDAFGTYSYGRSMSNPVPRAVRKSIEVMRPSLDGRPPLEHTTYEDVGPVSIICDADGQRYLIQPIRESLDLGGRASMEGEMARDGIEGVRAGVEPCSSQGESPLRSQMEVNQQQQQQNQVRQHQLSEEQHQLSQQQHQLSQQGRQLREEQHQLSRQDERNQEQRKQSIPADEQSQNQNISSEFSRMSISRERTSMDTSRTAGGNTTSGNTVSGPVAIRSSTGPGSSMEGHVGQMYLESLRHSAPVSIGTGMSGMARISSQPGFMGYPSSLDNMYDFLNQPTDAQTEYVRSSEQGFGMDSEWEIDIHDLHFGTRIGRGAYGEVFKGVYRETEVAIKLFVDQHVSEKLIEAFRKEVDILKKLRHPNILHFMGYSTVPPHLCIVTEYEPNGSLFKLLHRTTIELNNSQRIRIALETAIGMHYLHTSKPPIVHGDLKSPNLLLGENLHVKICDFGLSRFRMASKLSAGSKIGTPEWTAPEVLQSSTNSEAGDVYSYGVVLWELFTGQVPWEEISAMQVVLMVGFHNARLPLPDDAPSWALEMMASCFGDADDRPSFSDIITRLRCLRGEGI